MRENLVGDAGTPREMSSLRRTLREDASEPLVEGFDPAERIGVWKQRAIALSTPERTAQIDWNNDAPRAACSRIAPHHLYKRFLPRPSEVGGSPHRCRLGKVDKVCADFSHCDRLGAHARAEM